MITKIVSGPQAFSLTYAHWCIHSLGLEINKTTLWELECFVNRGFILSFKPKTRDPKVSYWSGSPGVWRLVCVSYVLKDSELEFQFSPTKAFRTFSGPAERAWNAAGRVATRWNFPGIPPAASGQAATCWMTASLPPQNTSTTGYDPHGSLSEHPFSCSEGLAGLLAACHSVSDDCCMGCFSFSKGFDRFKLRYLMGRKR